MNQEILICLIASIAIGSTLVYIFFSKPKANQSINSVGDCGPLPCNPKNKRNLGSGSGSINRPKAATLRGDHIRHITEISKRERSL